jgi:hypothetical protein
LRTVWASTLRKNQAFDRQAAQDHGDESGEDRWNVELVLGLEDEPAEAALSGACTEHELGRDQRPPGESPADLEAGQNRRKTRWNQDLGNAAEAR